MEKNRTAWTLIRPKFVNLWLLLGYFISTAAHAAVEFKSRIGETLIGHDVRVRGYNFDGELDYQIEARQELRYLKIEQKDLLNVEVARLKRLHYIDGLFTKGPLRLKFSTALRGAGQLKLLGVHGDINGQPIQAAEVSYRIGERRFVFSQIRYFNKNGLRKRLHASYVLLDDGSLSEK